MLMYVYVCMLQMCDIFVPLDGIALICKELYLNGLKTDIYINQVYSQKY